MFAVPVELRCAAQVSQERLEIYATPRVNGWLGHEKGTANGLHWQSNIISTKSGLKLVRLLIDFFMEHFWTLREALKSLGISEHSKRR